MAPGCIYNYNLHINNALCKIFLNTALKSGITENTQIKQVGFEICVRHPNYKTIFLTYHI